jgi:hypothetical protein
MQKKEMKTYVDKLDSLRLESQWHLQANFFYDCVDQFEDSKFRLSTFVGQF